MMMKQQLLDSFRTEAKRITFLASKLSPADLDFRFSAEQRSTLDLLQYLSTTAIGSAEYVINGKSDFAAFSERAKAVTLQGFGAAMERQISELGHLLEGISEEDLRTKKAKVAWGEEMELGRALVEMPLNFLSSYRMQLFLQAKAAGHSHLSTYECWAAMDRPEPKAG